jgi:ADP-ribose pyrophosphatase
MAKGSFEPLPWQVLETRTIYSGLPYVELSLQKVRLPDGREVNDFHQLRMPDYAMVVAEDLEGRILLLRQYKHGVGRVGLHVPGGLMAPGEAPLAAVQRELREETGYTAPEWRSLGSYVTNANAGGGWGHFFAAKGARPETAPDSGDLEEMELVRLVPAEVAAAFAHGEINSLCSAAALALGLGSLFGGRPGGAVN